MKTLAGICAFTFIVMLSAGAPIASGATHDAKKHDAALTVPARDRAEGNAYWKKLGVTPPRDGFTLERPWSPPWSGHSLIVPPAWFESAFDQARQHARKKTPLMIDAASLRADLPILHFVLEKNYSGWETAARHGWNWDRWFAQWDKMLSGYANRSIPDGQAFAPWFAYEAFQIDSHSGPEIPSRFGKLIVSRSAMLEEAPHGPCSTLVTTDGRHRALDAGDRAQQPHAIQRWNGKTLQPANYVAYPSSYGTAQSIVCDGHEIALAPFHDAYMPDGDPTTEMKDSFAALSGNQKGLAVYSTLAPGVGYLRLAQFNDAGDDALAKLVKALPASAGHEHVLVVDLRGNDGGSAPVDELSRWIPLKQINDELTQTGKRSCLFPGLWFNLGEVLSLSIKHTDTSTVHDLQKAYAQGIDAPATNHCPVTFKSTEGPWHYTMHHFTRAWQGKRPRLLVLVDDMCGSDCEYVAWMLAQLPGTVIAGSNTFGVTGFTQPGFFILPHTRIAFQMATSRTDSYGDDRSVNGYGLDVDVALPDASDWSRGSIVALAETLERGGPTPGRH